MLETLLQERQARFDAERKEQEALLDMQNRHRYMKFMDSFVDELRKCKTLPAAGVDLGFWRTQAIDPPTPTPGRVLVRGQNKVYGHEIEIVARWGSDLSLSSGSPVVIEVRWVNGHKPLVVTETTYLDAERIDQVVLDVVERLVDHIRYALARKELDDRKTACMKEAYALIREEAERYKKALSTYEVEIDNWRKTEQERLWKPWSVYEIKIVPFATQAMPAEPETFVVLEAPDQIALALKKSLSHTTTVTTVSESGMLEPVIIAGFYYGTCIDFDEPAWFYHRRYTPFPARGDDVTICVPAIVDEEPVPGPEHPGLWRDCCYSLFDRYQRPDDEEWNTALWRAINSAAARSLSWILDSEEVEKEVF